jgi:hypothetical protein
MEVTDRSALARWLMLGGIVVLTLWWLWPTAGTPDVNIWIGWMNALLTHGPVDGYATTGTDYPPGSLLTLWAIGHLAGAVGIDQHLAIKLLVLACLVTTTAILAVASRRPLVAAAVYLAFALNALGLMYLDILFAPLILGAVWAARSRRLALMQLLLVVGCLMKWQPVFVLPFALIYAIRQRDVMPRPDWNRSMRRGAAISLALIAVVAIVWGWPAIDSFYRASRHNTMSSFGANPLWVLTWWLERGSAERISANGIVSIVYAGRPMLRALTLLTIIGFWAALRAYWKSGDRSVEAWLRYSLAGYLVYFLVSAGVHENHLFLASLLAIALAWQHRRWWWTAAALAVAANLNLLAFYGWSGFLTRRVFGGLDVTVWLALAISATLGAMSVRLLRRAEVDAKPARAVSA